MNLPANISRDLYNSYAEVVRATMIAEGIRNPKMSDVHARVMDELSSIAQ